jgi:hypothetical protein
MIFSLQNLSWIAHATPKNNSDRQTYKSSSVIRFSFIITVLMYSEIWQPLIPSLEECNAHRKRPDWDPASRGVRVTAGLPNWIFEFCLFLKWVEVARRPKGLYKKASIAYMTTLYYLATLSLSRVCGLWSSSLSIEWGQKVCSFVEDIHVQRGEIVERCHLERRR